MVIASGLKPNTVLEIGLFFLLSSFIISFFVYFFLCNIFVFFLVNGDQTGTLFMRDTIPKPAPKSKSKL